MKIKKNVAISETGFMFNPNTGDSYSLNETAKDIVQLMKDGRSEQEIREIILAKYDVEQSTMESNFYDFLNMLSHLDLVEKDY